VIRQHAAVGKSSCAQFYSDIKNMAYYYVYPAFTNIVEKGGMK